MSCNRCANQSIPLMSQVGVTGSMCHAVWGSAPRRCATCGKWIGRSDVCVDPKCAGRLKDVHVDQDQGTLIVPRGASFDDTVKEVSDVAWRGMVDAGIASEERPWMVTFSASGPSRWDAGRITIGTGRGFPAPAKPGIRLVDQDTATSFAPGGAGASLPGEVNYRVDTYEVSVPLVDDEDLVDAMERCCDLLDGHTSSASGDIEPMRLCIERRLGGETMATATFDFVHDEPYGHILAASDVV